MTGIPAGASELDPFPWYARMRAESPVSFDPQQETWHVFGYDDVQRVLSDYATFSSERGRGRGDPLGASIISLDPPRHRQLRSLVTQAFTPRAVARLEPRIEAITRELLDAALASGKTTMEIVDDLATPLPGHGDRRAAGHPRRGSRPLQALVGRHRAWHALAGGAEREGRRWARIGIGRWSATSWA